MNRQYYFVTGNTSEGFVNFLTSNLKKIKKIIILKYPSDSIKTNIFNKLITKYNHLPIEVIQSDLGEPYIDGMLIPKYQVAILSDRITENLTGRANIIQLGETLEDDPFIHALRLEISDLYQKAYASLKRGLEIHDDLEEIYIKAMDFNQADQLVSEFIERHLTASQAPTEGAGVRRLFGTMTYQGMVTIVPELIKDIPTVFHIKGRAGTGKSYFMRKVMNAAKEKGYFVREYRCSFDPESIDMIHMPELEMCLLDSTDPHAFIPTRQGEEIIDLYQEIITPGTDEKYATEIEQVMKPYKQRMYEGVEWIIKAGKLHALIEERYQLLSLDIEQLLKQIQTEIAG